ncbi:EF_hand_5 domain-containing protein [Cephalotus follicularis]|uniref:EF_hand_5 domain-containing protein n=1 Tax=Cephalotus follicularis TaxID=3775 RepID=A0A1Q3BPZ2_CEPFO|nr:EF_hand_5 domain-containing protein [Cephalotus follicularis]
MAATTTPNTNNNESVKARPTDEELQKVFDQFDANKDGKISATELGAVLKSLGSTYTESEIERVMEDIDTDRDGYINLEEFAAICRSSSSSSSPSTELKDAFDLYDQDKNGLISSSELHLVLNRLGMKCSFDDCTRMITSVDSDGDGNVNFQEFEKMMSTNITN